ncbi:M20/M25/M40 family metallo-hydrolase [Streptomyces sp. NBC_01142]|uniref:M20/M25/M40 family metallo-hydrolase n=1 Tax=Streptomyces sp. NBC_01142 TaxID=2975865 RepID=UPI0022542558|nr:M20/M25/M40 family metallo-hydrolase [Streptomyces sp. NBC_01142]MCX4820763.1 M20/M25/M40 family metallo-hydrolase [Streptomyces sp. NBC_01142]
MTWPAPGDETELLRAMVEIPSFSGEEGELAAMLAERMAAAGFDTHVDAVGNVHGAVGDPDGPEVMLLGHIDTVRGSLPVRLDGDVLSGRGSVDAKGPLATMICAAARLADSIPARLVVIGAAGEEATSHGARHLLHLPAPDALIIGEPSGVHSIGIGYKGVFRFRMDFTQPPAHTSSDQATAAEVAFEFWNALTARLAADHAETSPLFERALPTIVAMSADLERAALEISCRIPIGFDVGAFTSWLSDGEGRRVTVVEEVPAVRSARTDPVVRAISAAVSARGARAVPKLKLGTSDWNVVGRYWQVPTAAYGPGNSRLCHSVDEHIEIPEYLAAIDVLTDALPRLVDSLRSIPTPGGAARAGNGASDRDRRTKEAGRTHLESTTGGAAAPR